MPAAPFTRAAAAFAFVLLAGSASALPMVRLVGLNQADQSVLGFQGDTDAYLSTIGAGTVSGDGRYVCFISSAGNLVAGDTNVAYDAFLRDRQAQTTVRVSTTASGQQGNGVAGDCTMTPDARYVVFTSSADNLLPGVGGNGVFNVYLRDLQLGTLELISTTKVGTGGGADSILPSISDDGRYVVFSSIAANFVPHDDNAAYDVFVRDRALALTTRVSVAADGAQGNQGSILGTISANGRYVLFRSDATNLVAGDTNATPDQFVRDLQSQTTARVSVANDGAEADGPSLSGTISADGRYVAFESHATNLVVGDDNGRNDVFVRDTIAGTTQRVSVGDAGAQSDGNSFIPAISADGRYVAFVADAGNLVAGDDGKFFDAFVRDRVANTTTRVSVAPDGTTGGDHHTFVVALSPNGRYVALQSDATNLVAGDTDDRSDVFVRDLAAPSTQRASLADASGPFPAEANGMTRLPAPAQFGAAVAFAGESSNLLPGDANRAADAFVRDPVSLAIERDSVSTAGVPSNGATFSAAISRDGRFVAFDSDGDNLAAGDANKKSDLYVRDRVAGTTTRIDAFDGGDPDGDSFDAAFSADGRYVAFTSSATNLTGPADPAGPTQFDVYVHDRVAGTTVRASVDPQGARGNGDSFTAAITGDGRYLTFITTAGNVVPGDASGTAKVVRRDLATGTTVLVSGALGGATPNGVASATTRAISDDGRFVVFDSDATNLVADDFNASNDVFVRDMVFGVTTRVSVGADGAEGAGDSLYGSISADGRFVLFESIAPSLVAPAPANGTFNVILADRRTGALLPVSVDAAHALGNRISGDSALSADGRNVAFDSLATNWTLDAGAQGRYIDSYLVQLIEPTTSALTAPPSPLPRGAPVTFSVAITGTDSNARGGSVTIAATSGESCTTTALVETAPAVSTASCALTFAATGPHTISATYTGSPNYLASGAPAIARDVVVDALFANGFE